MSDNQGKRGVDSFIICTSARTGSTLLCNLLESTGVVKLYQTQDEFYEPFQIVTPIEPVLNILREPRTFPLETLLIVNKKQLNVLNMLS